MFGSSLAHIFIALAAASTAAAHGIIGSVSIDGRNYNGANGVRTSQDTPMRRVSTGSPIYNEYGNEIICGPNAGPARGVADANPGWFNNPNAIADETYAALREIAAAHGWA